jgi:hypothetical protein
MLAFGASVVRLADVARHGGRAVEAVSELWPPITRLEVRLSGGYANRRPCGCWWCKPVSPSESRSATCCPRSRWPPPPAGLAGQCVEALNVDERHQVFFNAFTVREVSIRGLLATGRTGQAVDLAERFAAGESLPTPQWNRRGLWFEEPDRPYAG